MYRVILGSSLLEEKCKGGNAEFTLLYNQEKILTRICLQFSSKRFRKARQNKTNLFALHPKLSFKVMKRKHMTSLAAEGITREDRHAAILFIANARDDHNFKCRKATSLGNENTHEKIKTYAASEEKIVERSVIFSP